ncbi:P-loop containing nucleoside triphosphate hydrolase protein [Meira miltonrushii]|uniref:RNA helicase n=1 Tax=Meira miltonrushii TaxID=1280837 RepID=A0A316V8A4_9BASI|nr:P-loop containing nucleoside triphosphate hydrolase protein [Meira miltonrushii]PWN33444.1 P-loop containing nucleoside triphosphate hydrolase protein [Meira miltonrushii]
MAPRKKNAAIKSTGSTSNKAEPLPDWVKNKSLAKPPPKFQQQQQKGQPTASSSAGEKGITADNVPPRPPPLFPPGTKTPINLLNERIQKHHAPKGWLRPSIDARRAPRGWTFVVTLTKTNKSDQSNPFIVRFDARDPSGHEGSTIVLDSKEKAKHWGATYALFRLCSNLSLDSILPTGPREYWRTLAAHKAKAPEHLNWLWQADPFEASQKMQSEKEAKRVAREKRELEAENGPRLPKAWLEAREIRMAKGMRDMIEETVRQALEVFPMQDEDATIEGMDENDAPSSGVATPTRGVADAEELTKKLQKLGFRKGYAHSAVRWLSAARQGQSSSAAAASLKSIGKLSDEDACLEYLSIFCPEDDLPAAFAPSRKADSFVTNSSSTAVKGDGLALRWIEERIFKNAGYPRDAVRSALSACDALPVEAREAACLEVLLLQLVHLSMQSHLDALKQSQTPSEDITQYRADERMALEAVLGPERVIEIPPSERPLTSQKRDASEMFDIVIAKKPDDDIRLRICPGDISRYPIADKTAMPTFFVASTTLPAYLRLAMTQRLGRCLTGQESGREDWMEMLESGQGGIILAMVEELETCWRKITEEPPELSEVMAGVVVTKAKKAEPKSIAKESTSTEASKANRRGNKIVPVKPLVNNAGKNEELKAAQTRFHQSSAYAPIKEARIQLPAMASSQEIVSLLDKHRLLIIAGETGCGKTTQCPQFILDNMIESGKGSMCNIIVTQPRRLSAMGVASRVAQERCEELNGQGMVGYAIRGESKSGRNTKLLFTTTGVLLRRLSTNDPDLRGISHVFVDEVHERGVDSDLLLIELREVLKRNPTLRVILMSATIERETFVSYFNNVPTMDIPGRTFPVQDFYLEDVRSMLGQNDQNNEEEEEDSKSRKKNQGIDYDLIGQTVDMICKRADQKKDTDGGILVFLPGVGEIRQAIESIEKATSRPVDVFPLHANLSPEDQRKVFKKPRSGSRKVVVSTNVAETSITIDDIVYVVDIGLVKETRYDVQSGLTKLVETRCSKANARQRRGRAGRVRPGECFKLFTRGTEQYRMEDQQIPEMRRMSLENLILSVKALKGDSVPVQSYLLSAISPPSLDAIEQAVQLLNDMNVLVTDQQRLTALGRHLSLLPLDVRLGKLLILSCVFRCLRPMLTAAAILSCKPLFNAPFEKRQEASKARKQLNFGSSDILTDVNAYHQWLSMRKDGYSNAEIRSWCDDHFISPSALRDISSTRQDLLANLIEMGLVSAQYRSEQNSTVASSLDKNSEQINLQRALLLAALYPSVVRIAHPQAKYDKAIGGAVEREAEARQVRFFDAQNQRVFLHPSSILFDTNKYASDFLASFRRGASQSQNKGANGDKIYLRDATEVPMFALLLFGGHLRVHRKEGGISIGNGKSATADSGWIKLRAGGRIVALINQLRFLLDAALAQSFENPLEDVFGQGKEDDSIESKVLNCLHQLLERDGQ